MIGAALSFFFGRKVKVNVLPHGAYDLTTDLAFSTRGDSGVDLKVSSPGALHFSPFETKKVPLGIRVQPFHGQGPPRGLLMMPRSSIYKTPLRMSNSVGLLDVGYTGELYACLDNVKPEPYTLERGAKLVQLVDFSGVPLRLYPVDEIEATERGEGGFGSTG
jgi:dUTP pyrophosphatase